MKNEVYISKKDTLEFLKSKLSQNEYKYIEKLIDDIQMIHDEYVNVDYVYNTFDVLFDDDERYDEYEEFMNAFAMLPTVRFLKEYNKEIVLKEDVVKTFKDFLEEEQISPDAPDYNTVLQIINRIPIIKLEA